MADSKLADLTAITTPADTDVVYVVHDPAGTPVDRKITVADVRARYLLHVRDEKASGTAGGAATAGSWQTRTLNTVKTNEISGASLASNQLTLPAGTYEADGAVPLFAVTTGQGRLQDVTNAATLLTGTNIFSNSGGAYVVTYSHVRGRFTLSGSTTVELQYRVGNAGTQGANALGWPTSWGTEVYSDLLIRKVA